MSSLTGWAHGAVTILVSQEPDFANLTSTSRCLSLMPILGNRAAELKSSAGDSVACLAVHIVHGRKIAICAIHGKVLVYQLVNSMRRRTLCYDYRK